MGDKSEAKRATVFLNYVDGALGENELVKAGSVVVINIFLNYRIIIELE